MTPPLRSLFDQILRDNWSENPTLATAAGIHDHDDRLIDCSPEAIANRLALLGRHRDALAAARPRAAGAEEVLDALVLSHAVESEARLLAEVRSAFRDPCSYLDEILYGVYYLIERDFAPLAERTARAARRLGQVPRLLDQARRNLSDPRVVPGLWVEAGLQQARGSDAFLTTLALDLEGTAGAAGADFARAAATARTAIATFQSHLKGRLAGASGAFACGRDLFAFLLRVQHGIDSEPEAIEAFGRDLASEARSRLATMAEEIAPGRSWREAIAGWRSDHPPEDALLDEYRREVARARAFVEQRRLVTLPPGESLRVVETPPFQRDVTPFAAYVAPAPFEDLQAGSFWVTLPARDATPEARARSLADHPRPAIPATVAHEAYPGHHLQLSVTARIASRVRRAWSTPVLVEGWGFYCEELMAEHGYYPDPRSRLLQVKDVLWRACRVVIDVGLHTGRMTADEAARMLVEEASLDPASARAEITRYSRSPTQPLSYAVGRQAILDLRARVAAARGAAFDLTRFHDELLSYGPIPIALIRDRMLA